MASPCAAYQSAHSCWGPVSAAGVSVTGLAVGFMLSGGYTDDGRRRHTWRTRSRPGAAQDLVRPLVPDQGGEVDLVGQVAHDQDPVVRQALSVEILAALHVRAVAVLVRGESGALEAAPTFSGDCADSRCT